MMKKLIVVTIFLIALSKGSLSLKPRFPRDLGAIMQSREDVSVASEEEQRVNDIKKSSDDNSLNTEMEMVADDNIKGSKESEDMTETHEDVEKIKRETVIKGNRNRLENLINLPIRLNVLANILSQVSQGIIDPHGRSLTQNTIIGNDNTVSSLFNLPLNVNASVNVLSKVEHKVKPSQGILGGLLGGNLLGDVLKGDVLDKLLDDGIVGDLLGGNILGDLLKGDVLNSIAGGVLGNTLGDVLGALMAHDGVTHNSNVNGHDLVNKLLNGVLGSVEQLVDNLLHLLVNLLEGVLKNVPNSELPQPEDPIVCSAGATSSQGGFQIEGNNNKISALINAPVRLNALINLLSTLKQEIGNPCGATIRTGRTVIQGNNNDISSLVNLPVKADAKVNILSTVTQTLLGKPNTSQPAAEHSALDNVVAGLPLVGSLLRGNPTKEQPVKESHAGNVVAGLPLVGSLLGGNPTKEQPVKEDSHAIVPGSTKIQGNNNVISSLLNVVPDVNVNLNLLSQITELLSHSRASQAGSVAESDPNEICFEVPLAQPETSIEGNNNKQSTLVNVKPKINLDLNLLSKIKEGTANIPTQRVCVKRPPTLPPTPTPTHKPTPSHPSTPSQPSTPSHPPTSSPTTPTPLVTHQPPTEICFDVWVDESGTIVSGNNNHISNLVNVQPKINLGLNLLSHVEQAAPQPNLSHKRICVPVSSTPKPTVTPATPTNKPVTHSTPHPTTPSPKPTPPPTTPSPKPTPSTPHPPTPTHTPKPTTSTTKQPPTEICFDVLVDESGTVISGNNNQISQLINVQPKINLGLNLLSHVEQTAPQTNLSVKRICVPVQPTHPSTHKPTVTPSTPSPPTIKPVTQPPKQPEKRCFKRICNKWKQCVDYNCRSQPKVYAVHT